MKFEVKQHNRIEPNVMAFTYLAIKLYHAIRYSLERQDPKIQEHSDKRHHEKLTQGLFT